MTCRGQTCEVGHLTTGRQAHPSVIRQSEDVQKPFAGDLLRHRGRGAARVAGCVLVPDRRQPVGRDRGVESAADDEPEVPGTLRPDEAGIRRRHQLLDHLQRWSRPRPRDQPAARTAARPATHPRGRGARVATSDTRSRSQRSGGAVRDPSRDTTPSGDPPVAVAKLRLQPVVLINAIASQTPAIAVGRGVSARGQGRPARQDRSRRHGSAPRRRSPRCRPAQAGARAAHIVVDAMQPTKSPARRALLRLHQLKQSPNDSAVRAASRPADLDILSGLPDPLGSTRTSCGSHSRVSCGASGESSSRRRRRAAWNATSAAQRPAASGPTAPPAVPRRRDGGWRCCRWPPKRRR